MRRIATIALAGAALVTTGIAFAGQDEIQLRQTERVMKAKRAEQAARARPVIAEPLGPDGTATPVGKQPRATPRIGPPSARTFP
jgi:hypothetical protein